MRQRLPSGRRQPEPDKSFTKYACAPVGDSTQFSLLESKNNCPHQEIQWRLADSATYYRHSE
jgi:hypothetical protein